MGQLHWNGEISLGNVLTLVTILFTFYKFHVANVERITRMETKVDLLWNQLAKRLDIRVAHKEGDE